MSDKRVAVRVLFQSLDTTVLAELIDAIEEVVEQFGKAEVEATVLPSPPSAG